MKISECSFCGKLSLTENDICSDCHSAVNQTENTSEQNIKKNGENLHPPRNASQTGNTTNQAHESRNKYTPVNCWRCNAMNNWEQTKICYKCGCALRPYNKQETITLQGDSITSSPVFRSFAVFLTISVLTIAGILFVKKFNSPTASPSSNLASNTAVPEEVDLPGDSWHKPNIWNFFRQKPTVGEILEKNSKATSKTLKPSDIQTLSLSGNLSFANGGCADEVCAEQLNRQAMMQNNQIQHQSTYRGNKNDFKVGLVDYFEDFDFQEVGYIEAHQKNPDKILRKVSVTPKNQSRKTEKTEGFDGLTGWSKTIISEKQQILETSIKELAGVDLLKLKNSTDALKAEYSSNNITFHKMVNVKNRVQFVLRKEDPGKQELIHFDAVTGLITKIERDDMTCFFSNYSDYEGIKLPSTIYFRTVEISGNALYMRIEGIIWNINKPMEDSMFAKP